jgi:acyl dehydratase
MATTLDLSAVGSRSEPYVVSWTAEDAILYALSVGAGQDDPLAELDLTTQNSEGIDQQVLPTFAIWPGQGGLANRLPFGTFDRAALVHAEQGLRVHRPLPPAGTARATASLDGIYDKGSGALVVMSVMASDVEDDMPLWSSRLGYFVRGAGGFGGDRGPSVSWSGPQRDPDRVVAVSTRPDQALLYRLNGDLNSLHADPVFARRAGFGRPILHGLCSYGAVARVLTRALLDGDQTRLQTISARFSKPVYPGEKLEVQVWHTEGGADFRAVVEDRVVLDRGVLGFR